jgi:hypothetical protein
MVEIAVLKAKRGSKSRMAAKGIPVKPEVMIPLVGKGLSLKPKLKIGVSPSEPSPPDHG